MNHLCIEQLADILGGRLRMGCPPPLGGAMEPIGRIRTQSHTVHPGDVFWGLVDEDQDGSRLAEDAYSRGAIGAVVSQRRLEPWAGRFSLELEDTTWGLWQLARWNRCQFGGTVVAVTGAVAGSSAAAMIHQVLSLEHHGVLTRVGTSPRIDLPLRMLDVEADQHFAVHDLTSQQAGDLDGMAHLCCPHVAVITASWEPITAGTSDGTPGGGERELVLALPDNGHAVLNGDDPQLRQVAASIGVPVTWFGRSADGDVAAVDVSYQLGTLSFRVDRQAYQVPAIGRGELSAALAAIAVGRLMGVSDKQIATALRMPIDCGPHRQVVSRQGARIILDSSPSNALAMNAALHVLRDFHTHGRRIVVCGDLSIDSRTTDELLWRFGRAVVTACGADLLVAFGPQARLIVDAARDAGMSRDRSMSCTDLGDASRWLDHQIGCDDVVLVTGTSPSSQQALVDHLTCPPRRLVA
jgi:UDP-N-acetylmuramoyl-tripeptide--D-alanyl-D-alanine ligase